MLTAIVRHVTVVLERRLCAHTPVHAVCCLLKTLVLLLFDPQPSEMEVESQVHLYGHTAEVTGLFVCKPYSILVSVSNDGTCILWDLNRCVTRQV